MLYKNTKATVCSVKGDTDFFDIIAGILQGDAFASYLFIICLNYILLMSVNLMKENGFTLKTIRSRQYPAETMVVVDLVVLANRPALAKSLLHSLKQAAWGIGLYVNVEFICFKQGAIPILDGKPFKLDQFKYFSSNISSTESDIKRCIRNACTAIDRLSII